MRDQAFTILLQVTISFEVIRDLFLREDYSILIPSETFDSFLKFCKSRLTPMITKEVRDLLVARTGIPATTPGLPKIIELESA